MGSPNRMETEQGALVVMKPPRVRIPVLVMSHPHNPINQRTFPWLGFVSEGLITCGPVSLILKRPHPQLSESGRATTEARVNFFPQGA